MNWHRLLRTVLLGCSVMIFVGAGTLLPGSLLRPLPTYAAVGQATYSCKGDPANGGTSSSVCHALAITNHNYFSSVTPYIYGANVRIDVQRMACNACNGWITNEEKLVDWNGNYVEAGYFIGYLGVGYPGYWAQSYYWADSRPQDVNFANYHPLGPVVDSDFGGQVQVAIIKSGGNSSTYVVGLYPPTCTHDGCSYIQDSTNNAYVPTQVQMGQFLIGDRGLSADPARFSYRYYVDSNYRNIGIFGNYNHQFVDGPPYMYSYAPDTDFGTYCCNYNSGLGSFAKLHAAVGNKQQILQSGAPAQLKTTPSLGIAAIHPKGFSATTATRLITRTDVLQYVSRFSMPLVSKGNTRAIRVELLTSQQISTLLAGESTGFSKDHALWFVEATGTFHFPSKGTSHHGYEVFDPSTGNLVMFGGMH